jgi:transposase
LLGVSILPADVQDRDGARDLLRGVRQRFPFIERVLGDAGYQGPKMAKAITATGCWKIEIVKRSDPHRFVILPKRWIVERSLPGSAEIAVWRATSNATRQPSQPASASQ